MVDKPLSLTPIRLEELRAQALARVLNLNELERHEVAASAPVGSASGVTPALQMTELKGQVLVNASGANLAHKHLVSAAAPVGEDSDVTPSLRLEEIGAQALVSFLALSDQRLQRHAVSASAVAGADSGVEAPLRLEKLGAQFILRQEASVTAPKTPIEGGGVFFLHNWAVAFRALTTWQTTTRRTVSGSNLERVSLASRPQRELSFAWTVCDDDAVNEVEQALRDMTGTKQLLPIYPDAVELQTAGDGTAVLWSDDGVLFSSVTASFSDSTASEQVTIDTTNRRFRANGAVALFALNGVGELHPDEDVLYYNILSVQESGLTLDAESFPSLDFSGKRWFAVPVLYCEIVTEPRKEFLRKDGVTILVDAIEELSKASLAPAALPDTSSVPELLLSPDVSSQVTGSLRRPGLLAQSGRSLVLEAQGERYEYVQSWPMTLQRAEWATLTELFDGRRGRWLPFLYPDHSATFDAFGITNTTSLFLKPGRDYAKFQQRMAHARYVAVLFLDGTFAIRQISTISDQSVSWLVVLTQGFGQTEYAESDIVSVFPARQGFFDNDTLEETWIAPDTVQVQFSTVENVDPGGVDLQ